MNGAFHAAAPPRWAVRAAIVAALTPVPSGLWRMAMALGVPLGVDPAYRSENYGFPGRGTVHVLWITALLVTLSFLTVGLVRPWGERLPTWVPVVGGRHVHRLIAIIPAGLGAVALMLLWVTTFLNIGLIFDEYGLDGADRIPVIAAYAPLLLWSPLLAIVTASYAKRTRRTAGGTAQARTGRDLIAPA